MASLKACPSKLSFTCTQRVSLEPPLKGNIQNCDNVIETAFVHEPAYLDPLFFLFFLFCFGLYLLPVGWDGSLYFQNKVELAYWKKTYCISEFRRKLSFVLETDYYITNYLPFTLKRSTQSEDWIFFATQKQLTLKTGQKVKHICLNVL